MARSTPSISSWPENRRKTVECLTHSGTSAPTCPPTVHGRLPTASALNIVLLNQYYPPDGAPTGVMLQAVAEQLKKNGHTVTVFCASGGYSAEVKDGARQDAEATVGGGIRIGATRFGRGTFVGKLIDYLSFYLGVMWKLLLMRPRPDRIVALTTPPYLSVVARLLSKFRGADHAHWIMDLYPDVMTAHGMLKERSILRWVLTRLARWGFGGRRCSSVVTLGPDMAQAVDAYLPADRKSDWVPLWETAEGEGRVAALRRSRGWGDDETVFLYSGNMGLGHRFEEFLSVVDSGASPALPPAKSPNPQINQSPNSPRLRLVFSGRGKRRGEIEAFLADRKEGSGIPVELMDYVPAEELTTHLLSGDVHLASLEPSWDGTMLPSKLQGSFSVGRPVLFVGSRTCSIGKWIIESGGGWVVAPGDLAGLREAMLEGCDAEERIQRGGLAAQFAREHFDRETNAARVAALLAGC